MAFPEKLVSLLTSRLATALSPLTLQADAVADDFGAAEERRFPGRAERDRRQGSVHLELDVLAAVVPEQDGIGLVTSLQPTVRSRGYQLLSTARGYKDHCFLFNLGINEANRRYEGKNVLVLFRGDEPDPLLWVRQTNGANCDLLTGDIVRRLRRWRRRCDFAVLGAGFDWLEIGFRSLPKDLRRFAREVDQFCPDTLSQGIVKPVPAELRAKRKAARAGRFPEEEVNREYLEWMGEALDSQTPADLADYLAREKRLFLWWD